MKSQVPPPHAALAASAVAAPVSVSPLRGSQDAPPASSKPVAPAPTAVESILRLGLIAVQLAALLLVMYVFRLENRSVFYLLVGATAAFLVHASLPLPYRLPFFAAISVASVPLVLGLPAGFAVLGLGFALILICHLPIPFNLRFAILAAICVVMLVFRDSLAFGGLPPIVVPVIGSMFMFRIALYLHSLRHKDAPHDMVWRLAYFFMIPNICYQFFPVVDYTTFVRTYFDSERFRIYDRGVRLMVRGVSHLFVYRFAWFFLALDGSYVNNAGDVFRYMYTSFLLYTKISGEFHLIAGLLCLYGFRLPDTNHLFFLGSSATDFWRRANIYWKDAMMKLVYYPSFFRLRKLGKTTALALGTVAVFVVSWLLHAYQTYWLHGGKVFTKRDTIFWAVFGAFVLLSVLWEVRPHGRPIRKTDRSWTLSRGLSTLATVSFITLMWSFWTSNSYSTWRFMWTQLRYSTPLQWTAIIGGMAAFVVFAGYKWGAPTLDRPKAEAEPMSLSGRKAAGRVLVLACLLVAALPSVRAALPPSGARLVERLGRPESPHPGQDLGGYYEKLTRYVSRAAVPWSDWVDLDQGWKALGTERKDFLLVDLIPNNKTTLLGQQFTTNRWGMRDRDYELAKPANTYRIMIVGPSDVMGWGVADNDVFESVLEARMDSIARAKGQHVEVLNLAVAAASLPQDTYRLETQGLRFSPDLILLVVHPFDLVSLETKEQWAYPVPDSNVARIARRVGVGPGLHGDLSDLRLVEEDLDKAVFAKTKELGARVGAHVALVGLRLPDATFAGNWETTQRAAKAVDVPLFDCVHFWDGVHTADLALSERDGHPNAAGHKLEAACIFDQLSNNAAALGVRPLLSAAP